VIPGFEEALVGMSVGDTKTTEIPVDKAYGPHQPGLVVAVNRTQLPPDMKPQVGQELMVEQQGGNQIRVRVTEVTDEGITIDANHPLAGEDLTFDIELVEIA
jgi:FKBP-type peptidyl-prolyl cis-trans isomerase 2